MDTCITPIVWIEMSAFAERLRLLREMCQMMQTRLAALLEVNPRVYNRWERDAADQPQLSKRRLP